MPAFVALYRLYYYLILPKKCFMLLSGQSGTIQAQQCSVLSVAMFTSSFANHIQRWFLLQEYDGMKYPPRNMLFISVCSRKLMGFIELKMCFFFLFFSPNLTFVCLPVSILVKLL